jgi:putative spermidine/putrescine transport system ATP-binding protein
VSEVVLAHVSKAYGAALAVRDFSLAIGHGELVALLGPSGCGKTTTLRMLAGFIQPTSGLILLGGRDVTSEPPYRRSTGMVFQGYALFPHMTVDQNVAFGLEMRGVAPPEIETRVAEALRRVRLTGFGARYPRQLSGGQQQRVALARALVINPDVLLLDEPLSNLDAKLRHSVRLEIRQLQRELGLTTVFVTHDQEEALTVADRLVVMNQGVIAQVGSPRELYDTPRSAFVADFIGKSNFFEGTVASSGVFRTRSGLDIRFTAKTGATSGVLAVRPERMQILRAGDGGGYTNKVPGVAKLVTFLGPATESLVELKTGEMVSVHATTAMAHATVAPGEPVTITWPTDASLLLDASDRPAQPLPARPEGEDNAEPSDIVDLAPQLRGGDSGSRGSRDAWP